MTMDPRRLSDDPSAPDDLRRALGSLQIRGPSSYDAERGLERLTLAIASPTVASAGAAKVASVGIVKKVGVAAIVLIAGASGTVAVVSHRARVATHDVAVGSTSSPANENTEANPTASSLPDPGTSTTATPTEMPPGLAGETPPEVAQARPHPKGLLPHASKEARSGREHELRAETNLLEEIRAAQSADPARALALVQEADRRFPRGVFGEEREAIAIECLARIGRAAEARTRASSFLATHPRSPFAERVRRMSGP